MNKLKVLIIGALAAIVAVVGFAIVVPTTQASCDNVAIIKCGVSSAGELVSKYDQNPRSLQHIYATFGIQRGDLNGLQEGTVYRNGNVTLGGKVIATGAHTTGHNWGQRYNNKIAGTDAYIYPTSMLVSDARPVYIKVVNGQFTFAIMKDCGNPIRANAIPPPPPPPAPAPTAACDNLTLTQLERNKFRLAASGSATNGAVVKEMHYYITDAAGKAVAGAPTTGASTTVELTVPNPGTYVARAYAITTIGNRTSDACAKPVTVKEEEKPAITITKTVNKVEHYTAVIGDEFTYEIAVTNTGNVTLKDAVVTDKAPAEVTLVKADLGTINGQVWTYTIPELKVGEVKNFTLTAKYATYSAGVHKNTVCVDTPTIPGSPDVCNDATTDTVKPEVPIEVCELETKTIIKIKQTEYDASKHTTDLSKCQETPPAPVVELPHTGIADAFGGVLGLGAIAGASRYYAASRRALR